MVRYVIVAMVNGQVGNGCHGQWSGRKWLPWLMVRYVMVAMFNCHVCDSCHG